MGRCPRSGRRGHDASSIQELDPSVGVRRRHLPTSWGGINGHTSHHARGAGCALPDAVLRQHPAQQGAGNEGARHRQGTRLDAARLARGAGRQSRDRGFGRRAADGDARQLLRHGGGDLAQGAHAVCHARSQDRLCQTRGAGPAGDRRGRVLSHHPLGRLHARLRPSGRSQGSGRRRRRDLHAWHQGYAHGGARLPPRGQGVSRLLERLAEARKSGDVARLADAIPYARWMRIAPENGTGELLTRMRYHRDLIGNTFLPAIHGGTLGAMLEMAAIFHLLWETETETVPKIVNITGDYLRSARPLDVIAAAKVTKQGRRMVNVFAEAWQDDRSKPVATASAHFLVSSADEAPPSL